MSFESQDTDLNSWKEAQASKKNVAPSCITECPCHGDKDTVNEMRCVLGINTGSCGFRLRESETEEFEY